MLESIMLGFSNVMQPMNLLICLGGLFIGVLFGALPGFSATMAVAIFVPFTYVLEPGPALLLLSALYCGGVYGGSIPAVLVGIPGTPASAPTAWEGKALVKKNPFLNNGFQDRPTTNYHMLPKKKYFIHL